MPVRLTTGTVDQIAQNLASTLSYGLLYLFDGTQPADANNDESTYTLLAIISNGGDGTDLTLEFDADGAIKKSDSETWQGTALASGTVGWGRFYGGGVTQGAVSSATRIDFNAATSGAPLTMANTTVTLSAVVTIDTCTMTMPRE